MISSPLHAELSLLQVKNKTQTDVLHPYLSHHAVPSSIDFLAMFSIGDQVKVIGKFDWLGNLLQDVDAKTLTATLDVDPWLFCLIAA